MKNCYIDSDNILKQKIENFGYFVPLNLRELEVYLNSNIEIQLIDNAIEL